MPGATLTTVDKILKDVYLPPVVRQLNDESLILSRIESRNQEIAFGKQAIVPLSVGRTGGIGYRAEWEDLPAPGSQPYARAVYDVKYKYGSFGVSGPSDFKTRSDTGAFVQALKTEIDGARRDLQRDLARQVYGDGTGAIVTCGTTTAANVVVLASREPIDKGNLYVGQVVDIGTLAAPTTIAAARNVTAVNPATPSITIDGAAVTTSSSHFVFRAGNRTASASNEITGLQQIIPITSGVSLGGIDPSVAGNEYWDGLRDTSGGALDRDKILQMFNRIQIAGGDVNSMFMITSFGLQRAYFNTFATNSRYNDPKKLSGGFTALDFEGVNFAADRDAPWGRIYFIDLKTLKVYATAPWAFLGKDGLSIRHVPNKDAWQGYLYRYMNMGATRRNTMGVMSGLTDTTGY